MACVKKETEDNYINSIFFRMYIPKVVAVKPFKSNFTYLPSFECSTDNSKFSYIKPKLKYCLHQPFATAATDEHCHSFC